MVAGQPSRPVVSVQEVYSIRPGNAPRKPANGDILTVVNARLAVSRLAVDSQLAVRGSGRGSGLTIRDQR
jgi:hypothetical protein